MSSKQKAMTEINSTKAARKGQAAAGVRTQGQNVGQLRSQVGLQGSGSLLKAKSLEPDPMSVLQCATNSLDTAVDELHSMISMLGDRLVPVLMPAAVSDSTDGEELGSGTAPLAYTVQCTTERVRRASRIINNLMGDLAI